MVGDSAGVVEMLLVAGVVDGAVILACMFDGARRCCC